MTGQEVLSEYAAASELLRNMLVAAQAGDWGRLIFVERRYAAHMELLQRNEADAMLDPGARQSKRHCIERMHSDERSVRELTQQWMAKLASMMGHSGTQRRLGDAYGSV